jgi:hypothetical protein
MKHLLTFLFLFIASFTFGQTTSTTLSGTASDADGTIVKMEWSQVTTGPAVIVSPNTASTVVNSLGVGVWRFQFKVTDNEGATATAYVQVSVRAGNLPPKADAGPDQNLRLPGATTLIIETKKITKDEAIAYSGVNYDRLQYY